MKIAVVGEGPVGLVIILNLVYHLKHNNNNNCEIYWHKKRADEYLRRHTINIDLFVLKDLESLITQCQNCLAKQDINNKNDTEFHTSINCIETLLNKHINRDGVTIKDMDSFDLKATYNYDHVFLADGFASTTRTKFIYNGVKHAPLSIAFKNPILALYKNVKENGPGVLEGCNITKEQYKTMYTVDILKEKGLDLGQIGALISLVYQIHSKCDAYIKVFEQIKNDPNNEDFVEKYNDFENKYNYNKQGKCKNLWIEGFNNFDVFVELFTKTLGVILYKNNIDKIIKTMHGASTKKINKNDDNLYNMIRDDINNNTTNILTLFEQYKNFAYNELSTDEYRNKIFLLHGVTPSSECFGLSFNDSREPLLQFCKKINETYYYLIGDSCCGYPPGISLQVGFEDAFKLITLFVSKFVKSNSINSTSNNINKYNEICRKHEINKNDCFILASPPQGCNKFEENTVNNYMFKGGFKKSEDTEDIRNNTEKSLSELREMFFDKITNMSKFSCEDNIIDIYNNYQLTRFFNKIIEIICKENFIYTGGSKKLNKSNKSNKKKSNKYTKSKSKTKKNKNKKTKIKRKRQN
jgi:hypothetical protein